MGGHIDLSWASLADADLPAAVLVGAVVTIVHTGSLIPWESVRKHLKEAFGAAPEERRTWRGVDLAWRGGKLPVRVRVGRRRIQVLATERATPARLERVMDALANVPNLGHVRLRARVLEAA